MSFARSHRTLALILVGLLSGMFSALFGVGGGTVVVPLLVLMLAFETKRATATSLAAIIVTATAAVISHAALENVEWKRAILVGVPAVAGLFGGLAIKDRLSSSALTTAFAVLLAGVAVWMLVEQNVQEANPTLTWGIAVGVALLGVVAGVLAGLFGVGGGILFVPALTLVMGMPQHVAIGTSLLAIVPVSIVGSWRQHRAGTVDWRAALIVGSASVVTAWLGAYVADALSARWLRVGFAALLILTALQMARRARVE